MIDRLLEIDEANDTVSIYGTRYAMAFFRHMGIGRLHQPFELTDRTNGVVTARMLPQDLLIALVEWRDARQAIFEYPMDKPSDETRARWTRLGHAEHALMAIARQIPDH
jgi:hypothetical protein